METEHITELKQSIELAQQGQWIPMAIISLFFGIIILLLLAFWKKSEKYHHTKHQENDEFKKEYQKQMSNLAIMLAHHETDIKNIKERIS